MTEDEMIGGTTDSTDMSLSKLQELESLFSYWEGNFLGKFHSVIHLSGSMVSLSLTGRFFGNSGNFLF